MTDNTEEQNYTPQIRDILVWPDKKLNVESQNVSIFNETLDQLVADMFVTMVAHQGVGLAAPQIGEPRNIITIRIEEENPIILINPKIIPLGDEMFEWEEGCLSVPGYYENRERIKRIIVEYQDISGEEVSATFTDLYAFAIQHEYDHLLGKVFVDDVSFFKKSRIKKKIQKELPSVAQTLEHARETLNSKSEDQ